jgi:hypothetical protein
MELLSPIPVETSAVTKDIVMRSEKLIAPALRRFGAAMLLAFAAAPPAAESAPEAAAPARVPRRSRARIQPYLEIAQVLSADLSGGETLTFTSLAAGIDGTIVRRRISVQASYRYQRNIEWSGNAGDSDMHSGLAAISVQAIPGALQLEAGAMATRTGGEGRALGVSPRDASAEVYAAYAGPSLSTHAGPVAVNASYRLGYVAVDDDGAINGPGGDFESSVSHSATASAGMAPGRLPVGWTVGAGYGRTEGEGDFDPDFEGAYIRGDVVVPVSPSLAVTAGVGYENIEASQRDVVRDVNGVPVAGPDGRPVVDPNAPRVLTYDLAGLIYDAGIIWRPTRRTELEARAGHRYGGTTFVGSLAHQFSPRSGMSLAVYDTVETFGNLLVSDLSSLPDNFEVDRDPLTGALNPCTFGEQPGQGRCFDRSLQSIRGTAFRMRGASLTFSGTRGLWNWGVGGGYSRRTYGRGNGPAGTTIVGSEDESFGVSGSLGRRLTRTSDLGLSAYASWFDSDVPGSGEVFSTGASANYSRTFIMDHLRLMAAVGLYHSDDGTADSNVASGLLGLRYSF